MSRCMTGITLRVLVFGYNFGEFCAFVRMRGANGSLPADPGVSRHEFLDELLTQKVMGEA